MRKVCGLLLGGVFAFLSSKAGGHEDSTVNLPKEKSLLWRITGNEMKRPSYVFGTMHLICKDDYLWTKAMKNSLKASKEVCLEMDMDDPNVMMQIATSMIDVSGKQLKDYFSEEDYALVEKYIMQTLQLDGSMISQLKPSALISILATSTFTCANTVSYENNIIEEAKKMNIEVTGLEDPQEQITLLESLSVDSITKEIVKIAKGSSTGSEYSNLVSVYKKQDIAKLYKLMNEEGNTDMNSAAFIDDRNIKWIERMEERMDQKPVFFAVGAGHLWGSNGILNLLTNKGYKIEAVR